MKLVSVPHQKEYESTSAIDVKQSTVLKGLLRALELDAELALKEGAVISVAVLKSRSIEWGPDNPLQMVVFYQTPPAAYRENKDEEACRPEAKKVARSL